MVVAVVAEVAVVVAVAGMCECLGGGASRCCNCVV